MAESSAGLKSGGGTKKGINRVWFYTWCAVNTLGYGMRFDNAHLNAKQVIPALYEMPS